jgi:diguanylate cyclase (GGDEF)-like protein
MAALLRQTFRQSDVLGRLGGDEFVALVSEGSPFRGDGIIQRLNGNLAAFNASSGRPYLLAASIGVARYEPEKPVPIEDLLSRADTQMYRDKRVRRRSSVLRPPPGGG